MKFNRNGISVFLAVWLAASMALTPSGFAGTSVEQSVVPRGTTLRLILNDSLNTKKTNAGERFQATVAEDVIVDGRVMIRHGARVEGTVTEVERAKRLAGLAGKAKMTLRFDRVRTVNGERPLVATLVSVHDPVPGLKDEDIKKDKKVDVNEEGEVTADRDIKDILTKGAIGVAAGALLGVLFGNASRGVIIGSIGGAVAILAPKGKDVNLKEGTGLQIRLDRDLNIAIT